MERVSHKLEVYASKRMKAITRSSPIGYWGRGLIVGWYFRIGQG